MARVWPIPREDAEALRVEDVQKHLQLTGWTRDAVASWATGNVYRKGDRELVVPTNRTMADYAARMVEVVQSVADEQGRSPVAVLATLSRPPSADVIRLREVSPLTTQGYIPIREGVRLISGGSAGLLAAAHSACDPIAFHPRLGVQRATEFVDRCRLGVERGSFVAVILIPVPAEIQLTLAPPQGDDEDEPFPRQVSRLFMSALGTVRSALDVSQPERLLNAADSGVSGNLCEALSEMVSSDDNSYVEITADWARTRRAAPAAVPTSVTFRASDQPVLNAVYNQLKEHREPQPVELTGSIVQLLGDTTGLFGDRADQFNGRVRMLTPLFDQQVQIRLGASDFQQAIEAYKAGARVRVAGVVRRSGQTIELQNPLRFRLA